MGKQRSNDEWKGWCLGGVWEAFLRVGGRLQMAKICVCVGYATQMAEGKQREKREGNSWGVGLRCV